MAAEDEIQLMPEDSLVSSVLNSLAEDETDLTAAKKWNGINLTDEEAEKMSASIVQKTRDFYENKKKEESSASSSASSSSCLYGYLPKIAEIHLRKIMKQREEQESLRLDAPIATRTRSKLNK